ncbi:MAG: integrase core domain-containing protein [Desulfovibrionaceae bacterium]
MRDELLNGKTFMTLKEARYSIEQWSWEHTTFRPHRSLGNRPHTSVPSTALVRGSDKWGKACFLASYACKNVQYMREYNRQV